MWSFFSWSGNCETEVSSATHFFPCAPIASRTSSNCAANDTDAVIHIASIPTGSVRKRA